MNTGKRHSFLFAALGAAFALQGCVGEVGSETELEEDIGLDEAALSGSAYDQCAHILGDGLRDTFVNNKNAITAGVLTSWKCHEFSRSGEVDTDYWGYGYVNGDAAWEMAEKTCESNQRPYIASDFSTYALKHVANQGVVNAWRECMRDRSEGFFCEPVLPASGFNEVQFDIDWKTNGPRELALSWATQTNVRPNSTLPTRFTTEGRRGYDFTITDPRKFASIRVNAEGAAGAFTCNVQVYPPPPPLPAPSIVPISCRVTDDNGGCSQTVACPAGKKIIAAKAACNLEWGGVTSAELKAVPHNTLRVVRRSDNAGAGVCKLGDETISTGERRLESLHGKSRVTASCDEHDRNGGECHILGQLVCF